ncbi:MAG: nicotinamide-nucleotide amidase [Gammaproteobacteria bacterium]|jgi:nicotinamide-nucleotide amidase|nr:nicotinamide-nucleotide amidase [Gammaproteobacteria bacterium]
MINDVPGCIDPSLCALAVRVVQDLRRAGLSVVTAESCTGGLIAALLSHGERASDCLHGGFVVYTKAQKTAALNVGADLLERCSAVHELVAKEMVSGALRRSDASLAISVTGVLGPDADEDGNPPGLVYLGIGRRGDEPHVIQRSYKGEPPDAVRRAIIVDALTLLQQHAIEHR